MFSKVRVLRCMSVSLHEKIAITHIGRASGKTRGLQAKDRFWPFAAGREGQKFIAFTKI